MLPQDMARARKFAVKLREMQGKLGGSLGEGRLTKVLRLMVLFSVADEFSPDQFWETIDTLFPDLDIDRDDSRVEVDGWLGRYWRECQEVIEAWEPSEGEPMVKAGQLNRLNYAQVRYFLRSHEFHPIDLLSYSYRKSIEVMAKFSIIKSPFIL